MTRESGRPDAVDRVIAYHEATKHRLDAYAPGPGFLDWDSQPDPFRRWSGSETLELPLGDGRGARRYADLYEANVPATPVDRDGIGLFAELAMGLSAWKRYGPDRWALRNNPSSGNLHPTEAYLLIWQCGGSGLAPGLYHYAPHGHALERRARLAGAGVVQLEQAYPGGFAALAFSSIVWREAWKYGARAVRYCQLDTGHALGAARYAAGVLGWSMRVDRGIGDAQLAALLGLDREADFAAAEHELPELFAVLGATHLGEPDWQAVAGALYDWSGQASVASDERVDWPQITQVLPALDKPPGEPPGHQTGMPRASGLAPSDDVPGSSIDAATLIRTRRSAQRMDGRGSMTGEAFLRALGRTLPEVDRCPFDAFAFDPAIHLLLFVHRVEGWRPGLYLLLRDATQLIPLQAATADQGFDWQWLDGELPLYCLRAPLDVTRLAARLSCHQGIAAHGAFAVAMIADLRGVLDAEGAWAWRRLHWEAGLIGQLLYLEAESAGLRGTGIGCFYDDEVHRLLGFGGGPQRWQVIYHFTVGAALDDPRLVSEAPYGHLAGTGRSPGGRA